MPSETGRPPDDGTGKGAGGRLTRRDLLRMAGAAGIGLGVASGPVEALAAGSPRADAQHASVPFFGQHQGGINTAQQEHLTFAAFDLTTDRASELRDLLRVWTAAAARLSVGQPVGDVNTTPAVPTQDTLEAVGLGPARLTITFGFGSSLFAKDGNDRFGLATHRPAALSPLPAFKGEQLDPARSDGDLCLQACADDPLVAFHAVRDLRRMAHGVATLRWLQDGYLSIPVAGRTPETPRNLMGFKDGTNNLHPDDAKSMAQYVWARSSDGPAWMVGGSYMVVRRIRMNLDKWDDEKLREQERTFGRHKTSGAPLGAGNEFDPVNLAARGPHGHPTIPLDAHIRLARQGQERILRRGYSYSAGSDPKTGALDAGLFFICFQRDPHRQFVSIQSALAAHDALNEYITHTASGLFACPPGVRSGDYIGRPLLG